MLNSYILLHSNAQPHTDNLPCNRIIFSIFFRNIYIHDPADVVKIILAAEIMTVHLVDWRYMWCAVARAQDDVTPVDLWGSLSPAASDTDIQSSL